jgi:hypothetical protein
MDYLLIMLLIVLGTVSTASCSIGLQCLNKTDDGKHSSNHGYLSVMLFLSIASILVGFGGVAYNYTQSTRTVPVNASVLKAVLASKSA